MRIASIFTLLFVMLWASLVGCGDSCPGGQDYVAGACAECGKFGPPTWPVAEEPISLVGAYLNGDGKPDLAVVNRINTVSVLISHGDGTFAAKVDYPTSY